ncbi:hypothetical protein GCM10007938_39970 [Vibrio zhanjiangensis]|uniref:Uncharacterized protein n=1 Tax=Vibrio zhanjiangensis TaxID=1046128 RepID=A0ABQ6F4Q0_9VIBR|nr:hypothetical protein [Vibrio zhanjiangensis]GLT20214.1 hypothetical protein GCM10007938_39970 [Vibrio zhanjiangensis]
MKVSRFKALLFMLACSPMIWISWEQSTRIINNVNHLSDVIKVSGAVNDASSFAGLMISVIAFTFSTIPLITGKQAKWVPKIVFIILGLLTMLSFITGWGMNVALKKEIASRGYIECTSKRELALKFSSRTYALDPKLCD